MRWFHRPRFRRYRYRVETDDLAFEITLRARGPVEASRIAAQIGFRYHLLLTGPL